MSQYKIEVVPDFEGSEHLKTDLERAEYLQDILVSHATGSVAIDYEYKVLRNYFLERPEYSALLPDFVRTKRGLGQFWAFIKGEYSTYAERREYIWDKFTPFLASFEEGAKNAISNAVTNNQLLKFGVNTVHLEVQKALERVKNDPAGAITLARTVLESVCKFIADERGIEYKEADDLPMLYKKVAKELNLSPDQHTEDVFKQILGGCSAVVSGLGSLRNKLGDAHGKGSAHKKPSSRHAELAVNLAGSMAVFLVETHNIKK